MVISLTCAYDMLKALFIGHWYQVGNYIIEDFSVKVLNISYVDENIVEICRFLHIL
jgi:hypothetical protein